MCAVFRLYVYTKYFDISSIPSFAIGFDNVIPVQPKLLFLRKFGTNLALVGISWSSPRSALSISLIHSSAIRLKLNWLLQSDLVLDFVTLVAGLAGSHLPALCHILDALEIEKNPSRFCTFEVDANNQRQFSCSFE